MTNNCWTAKEDSILRRNAHRMDSVQLAEILPRSRGAICSRARALQIKIKHISATRRESVVDVDFDDAEQSQRARLESACNGHLADLLAVYRPAAAIVEG